MEPTNPERFQIKKVWLTGNGNLRGKDLVELSYNVTIQNIPMTFSILPDINQIHLHLDRNGLIALRDAIINEIPDKLLR